ncbi:hypothetical protein JZ751_021928 [Albula glossodonta]|uniref:Uncharacterized protein n=1 Tax=Albula glossodonta TaxID=121402 RepID=A0A8T2MYX2_9TELE|nr:hypothetical protein JZ751_021928 [Albula glossodonta]
MRKYERFVDKGCNSLSSMSARLSLLDGSEFQDLGEMMSDPSVDTGSLSATANIETTLHPRRLGQSCLKNGGVKDNRQLNDTMEKHSRLSETLTVLMTERDQLQTNYSGLTVERDQLQTNYSSLNRRETSYRPITATLKNRETSYRPITATLRTERPATEQTGKKETWSESRQYCKDRGGDLLPLRAQRNR